jgi:DNA-directed RNA polymerase subunit RPC12/RpoP
MAVSGTVFKCGTCGAPVPGAVPGQVMNCPYCNASQVFAMPSEGLTEIKGTVIIQGGMQIQGGSLVIQGGGGLVIKGGGSDFKSNEFLQCRVGDTRYHFEPGAGFFIVGLHGDEDENPQRKLRAIEAYSRKVLWEVDAGSQKIEGEHMKIRNGRVYASPEGENVLRCWDLHSGKFLWQAHLSDVMENDYRKGLDLLDPYPANAPQAAILVRTTDDKVTAIDRATGQTRWQAEEDQVWHSPMLEGPGVIITHAESAIRLLNPLAGPQAAANIYTSGSGAFNIYGTTLVFAGDEDDTIVDLATGKPLLQGKNADEMFDYDCGVPVLAGGMAWCAAEEALSGHPKGKAMRGPLMPGFKIICLGTTGDTLLALVKKDPGTPKQALLAFDPATLAPRYAQQDLGLHEEDHWGDRDERQIPTSGPYALVMAKGAEVDDNETTDMYGLDGRSGAQLWKHNLPGEVERVHVAQGYFQVRTDRQVLLYQPDNGQRIAKFPWND